MRQHPSSRRCQNTELCLGAYVRTGLMVAPCSGSRTFITPALDDVRIASASGTTGSEQMPGHLLAPCGRII